MPLPLSQVRKDITDAANAPDAEKKIADLAETLEQNAAQKDAPDDSEVPPEIIAELKEMAVSYDRPYEKMLAAYLEGEEIEENEHGSGQTDYRQVALDHLAESPNYYTWLRELECREDNEMSADEQKKTIEEKQALAEKVKKDFDRTLVKCAKAYGCKTVIVPVKSFDSIREKIKDYKDIGEIGDLVRGSLTHPKMDQAEFRGKIIAEIYRFFPVSKIIDRFTCPEQSGYRDCKINVESPEGLTCEVQLHLPEIQKLRTDLHPLYDAVSCIDNKKNEALVNVIKKTQAGEYSKVLKA